ncbi:MAG: MerR family transcriptional regulator [Acidobacteria bacterium]|nr:MerR family transcriptional regulator [Acidobacteriota bacterium]
MTDARVFDDNRLYPAGHPDLRQIAPYSTMAHWRCSGRGPAFVKLGARVAYSGAALNAWLAAQTVQPLDGQQAGADA